MDAITTSGQFVSLRFKWVGESHDYRLACWEFQASTFVTVGVSSAPVNPCESSSLTKLPECSLESPPASPGASTAKFAGFSTAAGDWLRTACVCIFYRRGGGEKKKKRNVSFLEKYFHIITVLRNMHLAKVSQPVRVLMTRPRPALDDETIP